MTNKVEEFYNTLVEDPDLDIKAGQTREQAARQEAEYRARQYNNNVQALALANEPAQVESPINALFNHLEQMKKSVPNTALIKAREDFETPADEEGAGPNRAQQQINERARQYHNNIKNEQEQRKLKGENYKREIQRHESNRKLDAEKANRRFQSIYENAMDEYNGRLRNFDGVYARRQNKAKDLERPIELAENKKTARKQAIEDVRNNTNDRNKTNSARIKQDRKEENENRTRESENFKEKFKEIEQRNLERAKKLQDSFAGETKADRIDAYRQALKGGPSSDDNALPFELTPLRSEEISFDEAQRRMYPQEGQAYPTQEEQHSIVRASTYMRRTASDAEVKNILNPKPLTNQEVYERTARDFINYPNIKTIEEAKTTLEAKPLTDEQLMQSIIDDTSGRFDDIKTVEDVKAAMNPKPFTKKEKYDMVREQLKKNEGGFFSKFKNKKITDADVTAALNPKRLTTEEKIEYLMTGVNSGGVVKLSREEALEALKKPKQLTNKEKLQNLIDSDLPQYSNIKTEADAKNYLNPKPLTEQQQYEYIANNSFSLIPNSATPEEAAKAFNNTPLTNEEKIEFIQDAEFDRGLQFGERISAEEAENILNPKNKHFKQPTFADDTPAETESVAEQTAAEVDTPTEESTPEETSAEEIPTQEAPAAEEPTGIGSINQGPAEILQQTNDEIANNNKELESNKNRISEIDSRLEELESKQDGEEGLSEQEFQELQSLPEEKRTLERNNDRVEFNNTSQTERQKLILERMQEEHQLTDDDVSKLRESNDINALIEEGTQPETTQEEPTPEPEQPEVTPEQSPDTPPATSRINPRTAAAAKEHLGEERYNELLENGDLDGKNIADIREEFPKPDAQEPKTETEEPAAEPEQETAKEPEAEAPQAETPAETPEPEPQAATPEMDNLIDTAKQNRKNEAGEDIEESSLFDHLYNQTHGDNPFGDTKEEFEQSLRAQDPTKLKTKLRTEYTKLETSREREKEQEEIKRQANQKQEANTLPHDESDFKDISENDATQLATEMLAHQKKHKDALSPASKKKLDKILAAAEKAGADLEKIGEDREKLGDKFGSEEHYKDLAEHHAEKEKQATLERHATGDDDEAIQARRRAGREAGQSAKDFHHGEDLGTKSRMSQSKEGTAEHFGHSRHKKTAVSLDSSNMPPAMREIMEEQNKDKPNKELISENKAFLAQKASEGYKWHPDTKHWVHEEGLNSLLGGHKGNSGTILDGQHQAEGHPPTLLNGNGSTSNKKVLFAQGGLHEVGGNSVTGKALEHSLKTGSFRSQNAFSAPGGKGGNKLNNVSAHTNYAGITTQETLKPTLTTAFQEGQAQGKQDVQNIKTALGRFKTNFLDSFMNKAEYPYDYPTAVDLLTKTYVPVKTKKTIKKSSIINIS